MTWIVDVMKISLQNYSNNGARSATVQPQETDHQRERKNKKCPHFSMHRRDFHLRGILFFFWEELQYLANTHRIFLPRAWRPDPNDICMLEGLLIMVQTAATVTKSSREKILFDLRPIISSLVIEDNIMQEMMRLTALAIRPLPPLSGKP